MKIALIFDKNRPGTPGEYVYKELKLEGHEVLIFSPEEMKEILFYGPDLTLAIDSGTRYIADIAVHPKALWIIDTHLSYISDETMIKSFDVVFVAQKNDFERLKRKFKFIYWLPLAADPEFHGQIPSKKEFDLAMIGNFIHGKRKMIMEKLKKLYPNSHIGPADFRRIGEIYSKSNIVINYSIKNDVNMRIFEGLCSGSLVITSKIKNNGLEDLFEEGQDLVAYSGFNDLKNKIDYYLAHEEEGAKIGESGRIKILRSHTYKNRVDFMISEIKKFTPEFVFGGDKGKAEVNFGKLKTELKIKETLLLVNRIQRRIIWKMEELMSHFKI